MGFTGIAGPALRAQPSQTERLVAFLGEPRYRSQIAEEAFRDAVHGRMPAAPVRA